jgi:hypothetical protein
MLKAIGRRWGAQGVVHKTPRLPRFCARALTTYFQVFVQSGLDGLGADARALNLYPNAV